MAKEASAGGSGGTLDVVMDSVNVLEEILTQLETELEDALTEITQLREDFVEGEEGIGIRRTGEKLVEAINTKGEGILTSIAFRHEAALIGIRNAMLNALSRINSAASSSSRNGADNEEINVPGVERFTR